jgi:hypothetical protein
MGTSMVRRLRRLVLLVALVPLLALAACHQGFGTAGHGGGKTAVGTPTATDVRTGVNPGFNRVVFQFAGPVPEFFAEYVPANQLVATRGSVVPVNGSYFLRVRFKGTNASASAPAGLSTPTFAELRQVKRVDNFEGQLVYGVGVAHRNAFRFFALTDPSRAVLDIQD